MPSASETRAAGPVDTRRSPWARLTTLELDAVRLTGGFWGARQAINRDAALPHGLRMLETAGNLDNLRIAAGRTRGPYRGPVFMDSDVYKWLEAAAYEGANARPNDLASDITSLIELIAAAQQPDGYLNSYYQVARPGERWSDFPNGHELYCAGHLIQAALALRRARGDGRLLDIARRFADHLVGTFGPGTRVATPGHPEIEMALVELYRETRVRAYLDLALFFVDQRGHGWLGPGRYNSSAHYQDRVPVREAVELEGHAVRAQYLAIGIADLFLETGEQALLDALTRQWHDLVTHKLYVTGAVGARHLAESVAQPFELPNELAYGETCAAIANVMWNWRMLLATGQARYAELMERALYNAVLSGMSLDGERYFYVNPLASNGRDEYLSRGGCRRRDWHLVACCPPNLMRLFASLGHYVGTRDSSGLQIHQYAPARIATEIAPGRRVALRTESGYPWEGNIRLVVDEGTEAPWTLALRAPSESADVIVRVNGTGAAAEPDPAGYLRLLRTWRPGDTVEMTWSISPRCVEGHPWIESTRDCVAIERGPFVYCLEQADHPSARVADLAIDATAPLTSERDPDALGGVTTVRATGSQLDTSSWDGKPLYRTVGSAPPAMRCPTQLIAIPYYAWANREQGPMRVWIPKA
ncbi:MAG TPA: beta-L-arabinofuranosidase domain-containing protein [bacterium]|nr:beta-L-arabinofuranosidase domain-containing protein [bacterium]